MYRQHLNFEVNAMVKYFVKNLKVHKYPVPDSCNVIYTNEPLHDSPPTSYEKCDNCFLELPR